MSHFNNMRSHLYLPRSWHILDSLIWWTKQNSGHFKTKTLKSSKDNTFNQGSSALLFLTYLCIFSRCIYFGWWWFSVHFTWISNYKTQCKNQYWNNENQHFKTGSSFPTHKHENPSLLPPIMGLTEHMIE
jgi:hypothetical protein